MYWRLALLAGLVFFPALSLGKRETAVAGEKTTGDFAKQALPFLKKHCFACHGPEKKKGGIALHTFQDEAAVLKNRKLWTSVLQVVQAGEMPPQEKPRAFADAVLDVIAPAPRSTAP